MHKKPRRKLGMIFAVGMFDRKQSGTIDLHEFQALWKYVTDWQNCFRSFDRDNSGTIDRNELKTALTTFGNRAVSFSLCLSISLSVSVRD